MNADPATSALDAVLASLRRRVADRRAHADYLESLIEDATTCVTPRYLFRVLDDVRVPRGVTRPYAFALVEDVWWIFSPTRTGTFPGEYARLRDKAAATARAARHVPTDAGHAISTRHAPA